jgi:hypothetical protein
MLYSKRRKNLGGGRRKRSNRTSFMSKRNNKLHMRGGRPWEDVPPTVDEIGKLCDEKAGTDTLIQLVATHKHNDSYMAKLTANVIEARGKTNYFMDQRHSLYLATKSDNLMSIEHLLRL